MRNPVRRSRNIGTARQGHGRDNFLVIPEVAGDWRQWWAQLGPHEAIHRHVDGTGITFVVEAPLRGWRHSCTPDDICHLLRHLPKADWQGLSLFLLHQPRRKEAILRPAWGRLSYDASLGPPGKPDIWRGPTISLEAQPTAKPLVWSTSLDPDDTQELNRLVADGHAVSRKGRRYTIEMTLDSIRATQLYRTLLHEIGHWLDWQEKVLRPAGGDLDYKDRLADAYFARPRSEREAFAHRYADEARNRLSRFGAIPFEPARDPASLTRDNLDLRWFGLTGV